MLTYCNPGILTLGRRISAASRVGVEHRAGYALVAGNERDRGNLIDKINDKLKLATGFRLVGQARVG
jgi:hypothetical protein